MASTERSVMAHEREIAEEQEFLDRALTALEHMRQEASSLRDSVAVASRRGAGDLVERDVVMGTALQRLEQLSIGDQPLFFGRIDYFDDDRRGEGETFHVGRLAVSDDDLNPLVVDWRAPVAEAFYRATGVESLGLSRRRHVAIRGREVVSVEDEYFADADGELHIPEGSERAATEEGLVEGGLALGGPGALLAALGRARTGRMGDIVATIQGEQDQIIRHPLPGILLVQGGPGTGKTAVALHRAAYLLFTHRATLEFKQLLQRIWPRLSGQDLLHDLFGAPALLKAAGRDLFTEQELALLARPRSASLEDIKWTKADAALIDEARVLLGPRKRPRSLTKAQEPTTLNGVDLDSFSPEVRAAALREAQRLAPSLNAELDEAEFVTYGHIVVDEAQDLSPMELRVLKRRDLTGSMTIVGDMGQATTAGSSASWNSVLDVLEPRRAPTRVDLTVSYRTPEEVLDFAAPTLRAATPDLDPPRPVRRAGSQPIVEVVAPSDFDATLVAAVGRERDAVAPGRLAVVVTSSRVAEIVALLVRAGIVAIDPREQESKGLAADLVVIGAEGANGLEFDGVIVVEPGQIARRGADGAEQETARGLRTLYVAMTRPTRRLAIVACEALPASLR